MIQGTGSNVGKSLLVAGLCRALANRGLPVRPFKPQNMSNNAAVAAGGEIGRAQALQAQACRVPATTDMNPVLIKPEAEQGARLVVRGRAAGRITPGEFRHLRARLLPEVLASFRRLAGEGIVIVEGAGSPAEINLRAGDLANMGFAAAADLPVLLVGDIDRGGVIAQLVGTRAVLSAADAGRIRGFVVNRFRGDPALFVPGYREIERRTGWPGLGVLPWLAEAGRLPAEDALDLPGRMAAGGEAPAGGRLHIAVPAFSRIANFDDFDPLRLEPGLRLTLVPAGSALPGDADLVLLPGTKSTLAELAWFRRQGWDIDLAAHVRRGGRVMGLCGGYQMLGTLLCDPDGVDGPPGEAAGLGLLAVTTVMRADKRLARVTATHVASGETVAGYEIHSGDSSGPDCCRPVFRIGDRAEGAGSADGRITGSYLHGCFRSDRFRRAWLAELGGRAGEVAFDAAVEDALERVAAAVERHLDVDAVLRLAG